MDKKEFNHIAKEVFTQYGFIKKRDKYFLILDEVTIGCQLMSWNTVRSFNYWISFNSLYDASIPLEKRYDNYVCIKMEHRPEAEGYQKAEIVYEDYDEQECRRILDYLLHAYFDPYKLNAIQFIKDNHQRLTLRPSAKEYLNIQAQ